jgi:hypothetical protein
MSVFALAFLLAQGAPSEGREVVAFEVRSQRSVEDLQLCLTQAFLKNGVVSPIQKADGSVTLIWQLLNGVILPMRGSSTRFDLLPGTDHRTVRVFRSKLIQSADSGWWRKFSKRCPV